MKTAFSLLLVAIGLVAAFSGREAWLREERLAAEAAQRLDVFYEERERQQNEDREERRELHERLMRLAKEGFFSKPTEKNFRALEGMGAAIHREDSREDENGIATGVVNLIWEARHMPDFASRLQALRSRWQSSSHPAPAPLSLEQCRFSRAETGLAVHCRLTWQAASWPGEEMPNSVSRMREFPPLPPLGRLFFTPEERLRLDRPLAKAKAEVWQGLVHREQAGKTLIWKDGLFMETENAAPEAVGGASRDLLRGGEIRREGGNR